MKTEREVAAFVKVNQGHRAEMCVGGVPGLEVRLAADGAVSYALRYWSQAGKRHTLTIGKVTLGVARERARDLLAAARVGDDPWETKRAAKQAERDKRQAEGRTLTKVAEAWLESKEAAAWRPGTFRETGRLLRKHFLPVFGDRDANTIARGEVRHVLDTIAENAPSEANHAHAALRALYHWLRKDRQEHLGVTVHPLLGLEMTPRPPRSRVYSDDELRTIVAAVHGTSLEDFVGILLHTGTRDLETRSMRWADVDLKRGLWTIPAESSKNKRPHVVAISSTAKAILEGRSRFGTFVLANPETRMGFIERDQKALSQVMVGDGENLRLHDIRRTVGDRLKQEFGEAVMHGVLGHADAMLTRTYGPTPRLKVLVDAMEWWAGEVARILAQAVHEAS